MLNNLWVFYDYYVPNSETAIQNYPVWFYIDFQHTEYILVDKFIDQ